MGMILNEKGWTLNPPRKFVPFNQFLKVGSIEDAYKSQNFDTIRGYREVRVFNSKQMFVTINVSRETFNSFLLNGKGLF